MAEKIKADIDRLLLVPLIKHTFLIDFAEMKFFHFRNYKLSIHVRSYFLYCFPNFENKILRTFLTQICKITESIKKISFPKYHMPFTVNI